MLPPGFEDLQQFVDYWLVDTSQERVFRRSEAAMPAIQSFYDAMMARVEDAIRHLEQFDLDDIPPRSELLCKLLLALPHAAIAVEFHGQPRVPHSPYPNGLRILQSPNPYGV